MTTPTPLAETIARVSSDLANITTTWPKALGKRPANVSLSEADLRALVDAASERDALAKRLAGIDATEESGLTRPQLLDRVDALAKRVGELEESGRKFVAQVRGFAVEVEALERRESKVTELEMRAVDAELSHAQCLDDLTAAQDRVRELEERMREARLIANGKWLLQERDRLRFLLTDNTPGPITDPTLKGTDE